MIFDKKQTHFETTIIQHKTKWIKYKTKVKLKINESHYLMHNQHKTSHKYITKEPPYDGIN